MLLLGSSSRDLGADTLTSLDLSHATASPASALLELSPQPAPLASSGNSSGSGSGSGSTHQRALGSMDYLSPLSQASAPSPASASAPPSTHHRTSRPPPANSPLLLAALSSPRALTALPSSLSSSPPPPSLASSALLYEASSLVWAHWLSLFPLDVIHTTISSAAAAQGRSSVEAAISLAKIAGAIEDACNALSAGDRASGEAGMLQEEAGEEGASAGSYVRDMARHAAACRASVLALVRGAAGEGLVYTGGEGAPEVREGLPAWTVLLSGGGSRVV